MLFTLIIFLSFLLVCVGFVPVVFANTPVSSVTPTISAASVSAVYNPGYVYGTPCGNTICLPTETCVTYTGETQPHCVPTEPFTLTPRPAECNTTSFFNFKTGNNAEYVPNNQCYPEVTNTQIDLTNYTKTCIYEPIVQYSGERNVEQYKRCGMTDESGPDPNAPKRPSTSQVANDPDCRVYILANTDVSQATLGSYGPSGEAYETFSNDYRSQNYLFNSLFDRPNDFTDIYTKTVEGDVVTKLSDGNLDNANREAFRTYWRLMPASNQANLRSFILNMAYTKRIRNTSFNYTTSVNTPQETSFFELYNLLKDQVIIFPHWPFFRIGCLVQYPVCPEYSQATEWLTPLTDELTTLFTSLVDLIPWPEATPIDEISSLFTNTYLGALKKFVDARTAYDAIIPLPFDSSRSFIVRKADDLEKEGQSNLLDTGYYFDKKTDTYQLNTVSRENNPYIEAIALGLLSPKFGLINSIQPSWVTDKYATPGAQYISDYKIGNDPNITEIKNPSDIETSGGFPEIYLTKKGIDNYIEEQGLSALINPFPWVTKTLEDVLGSINSFFSNVNLANKKGYTTYKTSFINNITDTVTSNELKELDTATVLSQYQNQQSCPLPLSYHEISPRSVPVRDGQLDEHHQIVVLKGNEVSWSWAPIDRGPCVLPNPTTGPNTPSASCDSVCPNTENQYNNGSNCFTRHWTVSATKHGMALSVFNNPKQSDIQKAIISEPQFSLYNTLLPDNVYKTPEAKIDASIAIHQGTLNGSNKTSQDLNNYSPNGDGSSVVTNRYESINRESNYAQDSVHLLQNCWTVPKDLQNSPKCQPPTPTVGSICDSAIMSKITSSISCKTKSNSLNIPQSLLDAIQAAGSAYKVPPSLIVGLLYGEGTFNPGSKFLDSAYVDANLACGIIEGCSPTSSYPNTIVPYFPLASWNVLKDAVKVLDSNRTPNVCNMLDMVYAIAKDASVNQNGNSAFSGKSCFGIPLNAGGGGSTSCNWDSSDIETAIRVWELGSAWNDTTQSCLTKENSCLTGGGFAAQCPTGGDSCETTSQRYLMPSHNACLYDKAISY